VTTLPEIQMIGTENGEAMPISEQTARSSWLPAGLQREHGLQGWYAVQTVPRHEKMVARALTVKGLGVYLPLVATLNRWSDRSQEVHLPLFPTYLFVRPPGTPEARLAVVQTKGIKGFVGIRGEGVRIPDSQVDAIRLILEKKIPFSDYPFLRAGRRVRIRNGKLDGLEGIFVAKRNESTLVISIDIFRRSIEIQLSGYRVELL
jgi:transcription antitermination factor NusG